MATLKKIAKKIIQTTLVTGLLIVSTGLSSSAQQSNTSMRQGLPGRRVSGGTRSDCMAHNQAPIVALTPHNNLSKTMRDRPSLYFVVPALTNDYSLDFSIRDSNGNRFYEKSFSTHENQGIMEVQLPPQSLQANQDYRWSLAVMCDAQDTSQMDVLSGWMRQVEPEMSSQQAPVSSEVDYAATELNVEEGLAIAQAYQSDELWSDAVSVLVSLRQQHPDNDNVYHAWNQMLQALNLESAAGSSIALR